MKPSPFIIDFIAEREGKGDGDARTPGLQPYMDDAGWWTVGYGRLIRTPQGRTLRYEKDRGLANAIYPQGVSLLEARAMLVEDVFERAEVLMRILQRRKITPTRNQFEALLSLSYNIGLDALADSTLLRCMAAGQMTPSAVTREEFMRRSQQRAMPANAPDQFLVWARQDGGREWVEGLFNRRWMEREMFLKA